MKISDVIEWIQIAEEDFYSAQLLNQATVRKPNEIICYHCAQAIEKYLKGYLTYIGILAQKTHNLLLLLEYCIRNDHIFENIRGECGFLNRFTNEIRYPHRIEIKEDDVIYSIRAVDKVKNIEPIEMLRNIVETKK
jgi:HEPN domain-containing protein